MLYLPDLEPSSLSHQQKKASIYLPHREKKEKETIKADVLADGMRRGVGANIRRRGHERCFLSILLSRSIAECRGDLADCGVDLAECG